MKNKHLEYYMDSKIFSKNEVQKSIDNTKKEFSNKEIEVQVSLNKFGVYVITFTFKNKNNFIKNIFIKLKMKKKSKLLLTENINTKKETKGINQILSIDKENSKKSKEQSRLEKYYGKKYGAYKQTHTYRPY